MKNDEFRSPEEAAAPVNAAPPSDDVSHKPSIQDQGKPSVDDEVKSKHRKFWIKTAFLFVLIVASIVMLFGVTSLIEGESMKSFRFMISGINWKMFAVLIGAVLIYIIFESAKYAYLLKISTGKFHFRAAVKVFFLGKYYDGITPLGTGGQPFQIYYLHKKNIPSGVATAIPLVKYMVSTIVFCAMAMVLFIIAPNFLPGNWGDTTLLVVAWISMAINFVVPMTLLIASLFPNFGKKFIALIVAILARMHIVKHKYRVMRKYFYEIREYRRALRQLIHRWWLILPLMLIAFISSVFSFSVPFFAVVAIANIQPTWELLLQMLCLGFISFYSSSLIPTPGNTGALEGAASIIFATVLMTQPGITGVIGWVILVWRLLTYYVYIFTGVGINIFEIIRDAVRNRRAEKQLHV